MLATTGSERPSCSSKNCPRMAESGFPDFVLHSRHGVLAPAKNSARHCGDARSRDRGRARGLWKVKSKYETTGTDAHMRILMNSLDSYARKSSTLAISLGSPA